MNLEVCGLMLWQRAGRSVFNQEAAAAFMYYLSLLLGTDGTKSSHASRLHGC